MIVVRVFGGFGNQLFQFAAGYSLALKYNMSLVLDNQYYKRQSLREYKLSNFYLPSTEMTASQALTLGATGHPVIRVVRKLGLASLWRQRIIERESFKYQDFKLEQGHDYYIDGYWQNPRYFDLYKEELKKLFFVMVPPEFQNFWATKTQILRNRTYAVHIRRGDFFSDDNTKVIHGILTDEYYKKHIEIVRGLDRSTQFAVFSDDIQWCKSVLGQEAHLNYIENVGSDLEEFELMKCCSGHILSNSTFGWWAAYLGDSAEVIFPEFWLRNTKTADTDLSAPWE